MLRMLLSLPFYLIVLYFLKNKIAEKLINTRAYLWAVTMGVLGYYMSSLFDFVGLQYVSAGIERIILFIYPTLAVLINYLFFKAPIYRRQWRAIMVTYLGIGIAYWGEMKTFQNTTLFFYGSIMVFLCGITYAFYLVGTGKLLPKMGVSLYTSIAMIAASFGIFTHYLFTEDMGLVGTYLNLHSPILLYVIALALVATVIPSFLLSTGMNRIGSNDLAIVTSIGPVATLLQANYILKEQMGVFQIIGTLLVIAGVVLVKKSEKGVKADL